MILTANYTDDNLIKLYERRFSNNNFEGALSILDKLKSSKTFSRDYLYELYAKTYFELGLYEEAIDNWFLFLSCCEDSQKPQAYNGLGACFYRLDEKGSAGYYFNEQLRLNRRGYFDYNDVGAEFFDDFLDNKKDYYIAYPYDKADFTKLLSTTSNMIKIGYYNEAIDKLSIIPYNSKFYVDALMQQSLCKYFLEDKKGALKDIDLACELASDNVTAICNAISLYLSAKNKSKVKKYMQILTSSEFYNKTEHAFKIALIYCELKEHENAEKFLKIHLEGEPNDLTATYLLGICEYNLKKFDKSIELFKTCVRLRNSYVNEYYLNLAIDSQKAFSKGKKVSQLEYVYDLQEDEKSRLLKRLKLFYGLKKIPSDLTSEVLRICDYIFENSSYNLQTDALVMLNSINSKRVEEYLLRLLLKTGVYDKIKSGIVGYLMADGYYGKLSVVYSNVFKSIKVGKLHLDTEPTDVFKEAYSICVAKVYPLESDLECLSETVNKMWAVVKNTEDAYVFDDVNSLSAVIFELSKIRVIKRRREFMNFFNANARLVRKYKDIFISYNFLEDDTKFANEIYEELF